MAIYDPKSELDMAKAKKYLTSLYNRKRPFKIEDLQGRSLKQNKKFHVVIGIIALETGFTPKHIKQKIVKNDWCKSVFYKEKFNIKTGVAYETCVSSKDLSVAEMSKCIEIIIEKAFKLLGIIFPSEDSETKDADWLKMQQEIENAEKYLK